MLTAILGTLASSATSVLALAVHPFAAVTTTVYIPASFTVGVASLEVKPFGPVQA